MSSISDGFDELALPRRKSPAGYAAALFIDGGATLDDLREAVTTTEEIERTARRVLGGANPMTVGIEGTLKEVRDALRTREISSV